ncbi:MAG: hypothetical protein IPK26_03100 [Planctomycetes bacterium]|nr:hypothetical protein [Planctomycetota bacterium]
MMPFLFACTAAIAALPAQAVLRVGPGGYADIPSAIAAASVGDTIEVAAGNYGPFTLDKALTITAAPGALVNIVPSAGGTSSNFLRPPSGTTARLVGLQFRNPWMYFAAETRVERGTVWLQDCVCEGPQFSPSAGLSVTNATAVLERCIVAGFGLATGGVSDCHGLSADHATVFASDCRFGGATTGVFYGIAGAGIAANASTLHCVRCTVDGGNGDPLCSFPAGQGILSQGGSTLWLADCAVRGGSSPCRPGGNGLEHSGPVPAQIARCTFLGGAGTPSGFGTVGPVTVAPLLGLGAATMPLQVGQPYRISYQTPANWPVVVLAATDLSPHPQPFLLQPALLPIAAARTFALLVADSNGAAVLQTTVPANPALHHATVWLQAGSGLGVPLQTAPALGGVIR